MHAARTYRRHDRTQEQRPVCLVPFQLAWVAFGEIGGLDVRAQDVRGQCFGNIIPKELRLTLVKSNMKPNKRPLLNSCFLKGSLARRGSMFKTVYIQSKLRKAGPSTTSPHPGTVNSISRNGGTPMSPEYGSLY